MSRLERLPNLPKYSDKAVDCTVDSSIYQSSVSNGERLQYRDSLHSLPGHIKAELSINVHDSMDTGRASSVTKTEKATTLYHKAAPQASCPDLGDEIEFEYSEEDPRMSLPSTLKAELNLDLSVSTDSTMVSSGVEQSRKPQGKMHLHLQNKGVPEPKKTSVAQKTLDCKQGHCHGKVKVKVMTADQGGSRQEATADAGEIHNHGNRPANREHAAVDAHDDDDFIVNEEDDGDEMPLVDDGYHEFLDNLIKDPRFQPVPREKTRPKSAAGLPQLSKSMQPGKSKPRPQSAGKVVRPYSSVQSKVRASIEAGPPPRRWQRSSIAWGSYNSGELSKPSSLPAVQGQGHIQSRGVRVTKSQGEGLTGKGEGDGRRSTSGQRVRPRSAGSKPGLDHCNLSLYVVKCYSCYSVILHVRKCSALML